MKEKSKKSFKRRRKAIEEGHRELLTRRNIPVKESNGVFTRWYYPIITPAHVPLTWRYDFRFKHNPYFQERLGVNATFNAGALFFKGQYILMVRVEGYDRKSFFAIARSKSGVDRFEFDEYPVVIPCTEDPDVNVYDIRLTKHEDGWIYGLFCTERKDVNLPNDMSAADAQCGIVRTQDLKHWERLPDLVTPSGQQRNVVLHPKFIDEQYALYTRPQDGFIEVGAGGGIGWALCKSMEQAVVKGEEVIDPKVYHTIKEVKNGQGPPPLKTSEGWLHLAHGVRNTAAGLRYVLYLFMTDLEEPWRITFQPGGYFMAPEGAERVGDVSNVLFSNGWIKRKNGKVFIYYASSDTRMHVATTSIDRLVDYVKNSPPDRYFSHYSVADRMKLITDNLRV